MPLTPEQQALRKDALTLKRLFPAYRPEHTVAEGFLALLGQLEAQEAPGEPEFCHDPDGELCMEWYVGDATLSVSIGGLGRVSWAMLAGDKKASGSRLFANERAIPAQTGTDHQAPRPNLSKFATVADCKAAMAKHEAVASPPSSARQKWETADELCKADPGGMLTYHAEAFDEGSAAALSQPVQAVPDGAILVRPNEVALGRGEYPIAVLRAAEKLLECMTAAAPTEPSQ